MYERMLDKSCVPTVEDMQVYCGANGARFAALNAFVADVFAAEQKIKFPYGKSYGWCVAHYVGKKLICNVFAEREAFAVMLRLTNRQFDAVYAEVSADTQQRIDHKYPCGDGGWLHYRVTNEEQMRDVQTLLKCKLR